GDLMSEAAAAAVKHHHHLIRYRYSEFCRDFFVAHVFQPRDLHFQIMIAAAQGAYLIVAALHSAIANLRRVGAGDVTILLGKLEVLRPAVIVVDAPARAL